ncbi:MAG: multidrug effflux MFS transporter [Thermomicrobiales bacterium]|nr:multidrug effflux MFS transporter [Thermomicrobiales bacterium]
MTDSATNQRMRPALYAFLALLLGFSSISTDLYLPAMPTMELEFGANHGALEWTVSGYLLGFSIGQLFWGPFSDRRGRKLPLAIGISIFIVGSLGCSLAGGVTVLLLCRIVQALGASAAVVIGRAIVADLYQGRAAAQVLSTLTAIMVIAPMIGPSLGARILDWFGWNAIFWFLGVVGVIALVLLVTILPETHPSQRRANIDTTSFRDILGNRRLVLYGLITGAYTAGVFSYVAGSSFAFVSWYGLSPDAYGLVFGAGALGIIGMNLLNRRMVATRGVDHMLFIGVVIAVVFSALALVAALVGVNAWLFGALLLGYCLSNGLISANALSGGLNTVEHGRGRASAFLGFTQYGGGMVGSLILGFLANGTLMPLVTMLFATSVVCALFASRLHRV